MIIVSFCVALLVGLSSGQGQGKGRGNNGRFPNKIVRELGNARMNGAFIYNTKESLTEVISPEDDDKRRGPPDLNELRKGTMLIDLRSDGTEFETWVPDEDIESMMQRAMNLPDGEFIPCPNNDCGTPVNESLLDDQNELMRRLQFILGPDTRYEVTGNPIGWTPAKHAGMLTLNGGQCSAMLIGPKHVITAGHCLHQGNGGSWYGGWTFYPRRNRYDSSYGIGWRRARTYVGWTQNGNWDYDIGIIELSSSPGLGWPSFGWHSGLAIGDYFYTKAYPGDKPYGTQWSSAGDIDDITSYQLRFYDADVWPGMSGGGWYTYKYGPPRIYGALSHWSSAGGPDGRNVATRITQTIFDSFCDFINDCSVCC